MSLVHYSHAFRASKLNANKSALNVPANMVLDLEEWCHLISTAEGRLVR